MEKTVHAPRIFFIQPIFDIEVGNFTSNLRGVRTGVNISDPANARFTGYYAWPEDVNTGAKRSGCSNTGDDDTPGRFGRKAP
jgi:hypothetical protein